MYRALWSCILCALVTVIVSLLTTPKPESELKGLVYGATDIPAETYVACFTVPGSGPRSSAWSSSPFKLLIGEVL